MTEAGTIDGPHPEPPYDPRFHQGIEYFNDCEFFEAHEVWEEVWQDYSGPARKFYQGLIQIAVCLHHFGNGNCRGAKKLYHSCRNYLLQYPDHYHSVNLKQLLDQLEVCCQPILESTDDFPDIEIVPDLIPEIHLE